jgi:predicted GIY-YIG superfamily endonuclease
MIRSKRKRKFDDVKRKPNDDQKQRKVENINHERYLLAALGNKTISPPLTKIDTPQKENENEKDDDEDDEDEEEEVEPENEIVDEGVDENGGGGGGGGGEFWVYVLESVANPHYSYVGFTVNRARRLRQHNGELKCGGANYTHGHRPWRMMLSIRGNGSDWWTKQAALQLEWRIKHVSKGRGNSRRRRPKADSINIKSGKKQCRWRTFHIPNHPALERRVNDILWLLHNRRKWTKNSPPFAPEKSLTIEMHPSILTPEIKDFVKHCSFWKPTIIPNPNLPIPN